MNGLEIRRFTATFQTRDSEDGEHRIIGRPVVIGEETDLGFCREIIEPGALDDTDLRDVLFFMNHDTTKIPLARSRNNNGNSTMKLSVDKEGIEIDALIDTENNADARALYSAVERGDIEGMSFMFSITGETWEDEDTDSPLRRINSIGQIFEVSAVNWPAYPQTELSVRDKEALDSVKRSLDSARAAKALESAEVSEKQELTLEKEKIIALYGAGK